MVSAAHELKNAAIRAQADLDLSRFLAPLAQHYQVDTRYTDFFGRNATCAANSIFIRI
jgi:hypothetical protein